MKGGGWRPARQRYPTQPLFRQNFTHNQRPAGRAPHGRDHVVRLARGPVVHAADGEFAAPACTVACHTAYVHRSTSDILAPDMDDTQKTKPLARTNRKQPLGKETYFLVCQPKGAYKAFLPSPRCPTTEAVRVLRLIKDPTQKQSVGASEEDIWLDDESISRIHATIRVGKNKFEIQDNGSRNGTRINDGPKLAPAKWYTISSGDIIHVGESSLVLYDDCIVFDLPADDLPGFKQRIQSSLATAQEGTDTPYRLICIGIGLAAPGFDLPATVTKLSAQLRRTDAIGRSSDHLLIWQRCDDYASSPEDLLSALGRAAGAARVGVASYPIDGADADALIKAASEAVDKTQAGACLNASDARDLFCIAGKSIVVADPKMKELFKLVRKVAPYNDTIMIKGETGVGKESVARALHDWSQRTGQYQARLCSTIPEELIESELFGHTKGAFTDSKKERLGLFREAEGGTVFLDEVDRLSWKAQTALLRCLEERVIRPVGSDRDIPFNARVIVSTKPNIEDRICLQEFLPDLFYRFTVSIEVPPLRERRREISLLSHTFLDNIRRERNFTNTVMIAPEVLEVFHSYDWPGNIREMDNVLKHAVFRAELRHADAAGTTERVVILAQDLPGSLSRREPEQAPTAQPAAILDHYRSVERQCIVQMLQQHKNSGLRVAAAMGISLPELLRRCIQYGLPAPK